jgi:hypothetical protein
MRHISDVMAEMPVWRANRNRMLRELDVKSAKGAMPGASSDEVVLIALHKARYECTDIEADLRHASGTWLRQHGFECMHGPLLPEGELPA